MSSNSRLTWPQSMHVYLLLLLRVVWDTVVLFLILRVAIRERAPEWHSLALVCFGMAVLKGVLYVPLKVLAIVPVLIALGLLLRWGYSLSTRNTIYVLAAFVFVGIVFGSVRKMASGVLELFFI